MTMELIYAYKDYKVIIDRIREIERQIDAITDERSKMAKKGLTVALEHRREEHNALWDERHKLEEKEEKMRPQLIPEVGMPCTVRWYSDSSGAHVEKILSPKCIQVKCDGLYSCTKIFSFRRNGHWVEKGTTSRDWGTLLILGYRHDYYDMSF